MYMLRPQPPCCGTFRKSHGEFLRRCPSQGESWHLSELPEKKPSSIPALGDGVTRNFGHLVKGVDIIGAQFNAGVLFPNPQTP